MKRRGIGKYGSRCLSAKSFLLMAKSLAYIEGENPEGAGFGKQILGDIDDFEEIIHMRDGDQYFEWSPDSKWLLAQFRPTLANGEVVLLDASGKTMENLTQSGYGDSRPKWVNGGKQMIWFSNRDGLKGFATSGRSQNDVFALFFTKEAFDKFSLSKEDFDLMRVEKAGKKKRRKRMRRKTPTRRSKTLKLTLGRPEGKKSKN